jgi:hypothetical protein
MAAQHLNVFSSPNFPQILMDAIDRAVSRVIAVSDQAHLACCSYESPESRIGACDGMPCIQKATVYHLESGRELCLTHFRKEARRG